MPIDDADRYEIGDPLAWCFAWWLHKLRDVDYEPDRLPTDVATKIRFAMKMRRVELGNGPQL